MPYTYRKYRFILLLLLTAILVRAACAEETIKSKYFNIHLSGSVDKIQLLEKLKADCFLRMRVGLPEQESKGSRNDSAMVGDTLDAMYLEVSDIIDMHLYSLNINVEILPDKAHLANVLKENPAEDKDTVSFYNYDKNTIYISYEDMNAVMLSHQMAHAIASHYFAAPPPARIQELLASYAENGIRKDLRRAIQK